MKGRNTLFSSENSEWETPQDLFDRLHACFGFTVDVCASKKNAKLPRYWDKRIDGLKQDWNGERCWCNPPYGPGLIDWINMGLLQQKGLVCYLLPARTDTKAFQSLLHCGKRIHFEFLKGRLKFGGAEQGAPFPSVVVTLMNW